MQYYGVPVFEEISQWEALEIPYEYQDFMLPDLLDDRQRLEERVNAYAALGRPSRRDVIHGPFLDIAVHSSDRAIREVSQRRIQQVCRVAETLQAKAIVLHTNIIPNFYQTAYRQEWILRNEAYIHSLLEAYPGLYVYMENMFDEEPDCLVALARRLRGQRFGICLDIAHASLSKTPIDEWLRACDPYISHYHLNDNRGLTDDHLPVGTGCISWGAVLPQLKAGASRLLEVDTLEKYCQSAAYLQAL